MSSLTKDRSALADAFLESYLCWREACEDVSTAYRAWSASNRQQRGVGFSTYRAALDREECAARVYSHWAERLAARVR